MRFKKYVSCKENIRIIKKVDNFKLLPYKINKLLIYSSMFLTYSLALNETKYSQYFKDFKFFLTNNNKLIVHDEYSDDDFVKYIKKFRLKELDTFDISKNLLKYANKHIVFIVFNPSINDINIINEITYLKNRYRNVYFIYLLKSNVLKKLETSNIENYERI